VEISYAQIKCSIADLTFDLTVEYWHVHNCKI
jgi:hypothetical protein